MYRLMIVDDEDFITDSLAYMLENAEGLELDVYKAYSAAQALEYLNKFSFDIVVTDIQMPGMTGVALLQEIRVKWPACQVIFLTGYDEFEYAYQAIQYGAAKYVLKNEGDDVLLAAIAGCVEAIEQDARNTERLKRAENYINVYKPMIRRSFLQSLITGPPLCSRSHEKDFRRLEIELDLTRPVFLLAGCVDAQQGDSAADAVDLIVREKIGHAINSELAWVGLPLLVWLMQPRRSEGAAQVGVVVKGMAENIRRVCVGTLGVGITLILDSRGTGWDALPQRFSLLKNMVEQRLAPCSGIALVEMAYYLDKPEAIHADDPSDFAERLYRYMRENLDADLSLCALSEKVYLNPSYLSRRFKEMTGRNITDVITELRVSAARELLKDGQQKIGSIAAKVGYESAAHFSRVFKQHTGMAPREYRARRLL